MVVTALFLAVLNFSDVVIYQYVRHVEPGAQVTARADPDGYTVHVTGETDAELWMQRRVEPAIDPRIHAAMQEAADRATSELDRQNLLYEIQDDRQTARFSERLAAWLPNAIWLLTPLFALLLGRLFGRRRLFMEHLVFALWAHVTAFTLLMLLALANRFGANCRRGRWSFRTCSISRGRRPGTMACRWFRPPGVLRRIWRCICCWCSCRPRSSWRSR
ncbi:hypothetical protein [Brevundimonas denitrificans]|uniref:hypothetical protein n=1 Tax=Brevundimonas denitrificans TaxID=1443434 RepID=UPI00223AC20D|nr:hypothetical protein [Brevundimonas denitrificans]